MTKQVRFVIPAALREQLRRANPMADTQWFVKDDITAVLDELERVKGERDAAVTLLKRIDDAADGVVAFTIWIGLNHGDDIDGFEEQASLSVDPLQDLRRDITAFVAALAASGGTG